MAEDPVSDRSGFLCTYMSSHPDTLVAYVKHFGKVDGNVSSAKMLSIDSKVRLARPSVRSFGGDGVDKNEGALSFSYIDAPLLQGMNLEFTIKDSAAKPQVVRVAFDPPLVGYEEVKPRLLGMKADADEALGTVRDPLRSSPQTHSVSLSPPLAVPTPTSTPALDRWPAASPARSNCFTHSCLHTYTHTGQSPANHALRSAVPDLDHRLAPPLSDLLHDRAGTHNVPLLVARAHRPIPPLPARALHRHLGHRDRHSRRGGRICDYPRTQASHAVAYRGACSFFRAKFLFSHFELVSAEPNVGFSQMAWVGFTTVFGAPVLIRLRRLIKQARIESIMKGN